MNRYIRGGGGGGLEGRKGWVGGVRSGVDRASPFFIFLHRLLVYKMSPRIEANIDERGLLNIYSSHKLYFLDVNSSYIGSTYLNLEDFI